MNSKTCGKCKQKKSIKDFHWKKTENRANSWCKECVYQRQRLRWTERKIRAVALFGSKCCQCGYDKNLGALSFHHKNPSDKDYEWRKIRQLPWPELIIELKKCILVCSNCHAEIHYPRLTMKSLAYSSADNAFLNDRKQIELTSTGQCPMCKRDVYGTKYCSLKCSQLGSRKVKRPSKAVLAREIKKMSWCKLGRIYGVSDNAVRRWAKAYKLI